MGAGTPGLGIEVASELAVATADCRLCGAPLAQTFVDLGVSPLANTYLTADELRRPEVFYPLRVYVCEQCLLVQLPMWETPERIFSDYSYFSSYSESWVEHARRFVDDVVARFGLGPGNRVVEIASNDGYLLQFVRARGIPALGIEPAANVAAVATARGIDTLIDFFGARLAASLVEQGITADLIVGNNVLAHVPVVHDFVEGLRLLLARGGTITMELPYVLRLIEKREFDTIYHEHFSYFSLIAVERLFADHDLVIFDVEELPTHGGSLRIYARHAADGTGVEAGVERVRALDRAAGLDTLSPYLEFDRAVRELKHELLTFLIGAKRAGKTVVGYGAAAKGNTLLNYCGIGTDLVDYVVDRNPHKQGRWLPGTRIPIVSPERITETRPDLVLILPWNLADEIASQMAHIADWGGRFVVPIPHVRLLD
jgi:SAM-dependent methyltransferase